MVMKAEKLVRQGEDRFVPYINPFVEVEPGERKVIRFLADTTIIAYCGMDSTRGNVLIVGSRGVVAQVQEGDGELRRVNLVPLERKEVRGLFAKITKGQRLQINLISDPGKKVCLSLSDSHAEK